MIRVVLARLLFAFAAACVLAASTGLAVPAHQEESGTPLLHDHVLAAYRFIFLPVAQPHPEMSPLMAKLHRTLMEAGVPMDALSRMPGMTGQQQPTALPVVKSAGLSPIQDLAIEFALLVIVVARLARPTRRLIAELAAPRLGAALWQLLPALSPPRAFVLP